MSQTQEEGTAFQYWEKYGEKDREQWRSPAESSVTCHAITGRILPEHPVRKAKLEEMVDVKRVCVWIKVPLAKCWDETGMGPVGKTWVVVKKGYDENPDIRARLCAQDSRARAAGEKKSWRRLHRRSARCSSSAWG